MHGSPVVVHGGSNPRSYELDRNGNEIVCR
jgi:hypothetical protein